MPPTSCTRLSPQRTLKEKWAWMVRTCKSSAEFCVDDEAQPEAQFGRYGKPTHNVYAVERLAYDTLLANKGILLNSDLRIGPTLEIVQNVEHPHRNEPEPQAGSRRADVPQPLVEDCPEIGGLNSAWHTAARLVRAQTPVGEAVPSSAPRWLARWSTSERRHIRSISVLGVEDARLPAFIDFLGHVGPACGSTLPIISGSTAASCPAGCLLRR